MFRVRSAVKQPSRGIAPHKVCECHLMKPSEAIRGHQEPSEAIRGHQRPSAAIEEHRKRTHEKPLCLARLHQRGHKLEVARLGRDRKQSEAFRSNQKQSEGTPKQ